MQTFDNPSFPDHLSPQCLLGELVNVTDQAHVQRGTAGLVTDG